MILPGLEWFEQFWVHVMEGGTSAIVAVMETIQKLLGLVEEMKQLVIAKEKTRDRLLLEKETLKNKIADLEQKIADIEDIPEEVWCVDYSIDIPPGTEIGTMEIPGEKNIITIQPGYDGVAEIDYTQAIYNEDRDGVLMPIWAMTIYGSGAGWFWNAAMMPGWQKWAPLWRIGTIVEFQDLEDGSRTATIELSQWTSYSSMQSGRWGSFDYGHVQVTIPASGLDIDQDSMLYSVPFDYMTCDDMVFTERDEVVIEFREVDEQQWKKQIIQETKDVLTPLWEKANNWVERSNLRQAGIPEYEEQVVTREEWVENGTGKRRDWSKPVVIGFVQDPRPCDYVYWVKVYHDYVGEIKPGSVGYDEEYFDILVETPRDPFILGNFYMTLSHPHKVLEYDDTKQMWKITCTREYTYDDDPDKKKYIWEGENVWIRVIGVYNGLDTQYPRRYGASSEHDIRVSNLYKFEDYAHCYKQYIIHLPYWDDTQSTMPGVEQGGFYSELTYIPPSTYVYYEPIWDDCPPIPLSRFKSIYNGRMWSKSYTTWTEEWWEFVKGTIYFTGAVISSIPYLVVYTFPKILELRFRWDTLITFPPGVNCLATISCNGDKRLDEGQYGFAYTVETDTGHVMLLNNDYEGNEETIYREYFQPTGTSPKYHYCKVIPIIPNISESGECNGQSWIRYPFSMIFVNYYQYPWGKSDFCTARPAYERS